MTKSDYEVEVFEQFICIRDLNMGGMSVTNNIESVVKEIAVKVYKELGQPLRCFKLLYMDSEKTVDGIRTCDNRFHSFYGLGMKTFREASLNALGMVIDEKGNLLS